MNFEHCEANDFLIILHRLRILHPMRLGVERKETLLPKCLQGPFWPQLKFIGYGLKFNVLGLLFLFLPLPPSLYVVIKIMCYLHNLDEVISSRVSLYLMKCSHLNRFSNGLITWRLKEKNCMQFSTNPNNIYNFNRSNKNFSSKWWNLWIVTIFFKWSPLDFITWQSKLGFVFSNL
jgi:hypothetical protein